MAERKEIEGILSGKSFFKASREIIKQSLLSLPEDCNGFLYDLANRPETLANVRVLSIEEVLIPDVRPIFGIFVAMKVQDIKNPGTVFHYQYFSWKQGPESGAKGILLLRHNDQISHLVLVKSQKFATAMLEFDCVGGFARPNEPLGMNISREVQEELGLTEIPQMEIIDLGVIKPDAGMTNNAPRIFAAIIDKKMANKIKAGDVVNPDIWEMAASVVVPVKQLIEFVNTNNDGMFHICITRLMAKGILKIE